MSKDRFMVTPAVYILVINEKQECLFIKRSNTGYRDGFWSLPAGHLEGGEPASVAAKRELLEEIGIEVALDDLEFVNITHRCAEEDPTAERMDLFFQTTKWLGVPQNKEPHKCSEIGWFSFTELPQPMVELVASTIADIHSRQYFSEFNW